MGACLPSTWDCPGFDAVRTLALGARTFFTELTLHDPTCVVKFVHLLLWGSATSPTGKTAEIPGII